MNTRIIVILVGLLVAAGALIALALSGGTRELTVNDLLDGRWPPAGTDPSLISSTEVAITGYCASVDRPVGPTRIRIVQLPPETSGFDQPGIDILIEPGAKLPDEVRVRAWTRAHGTWDPEAKAFTANRVQMKCPSAEKQKLGPGANTTTTSSSR
ncbi:MAG: hypothetical protein AB7K09_12730 [Planctomycetota bacterium]